MLRRKLIPIFFALGTAMLAACGSSPTAPFSDPPAAVRSATPARTSVSASPVDGAEARVNSSRRGRSKYSVILF